MDILDRAVGKWEDIVHGGGEDGGADNCSLCQEFADEDCEKCPIKLDTGEIMCDGTPYKDWAAHHNLDHKQPHVPYKIQEGCEMCEELAQKQLDYMKLIREEATNG